MLVREPEATEVGQLARIWHDGWQDAHANILPAALARLRTLPSFHERMQASLADVRVVGAVGSPTGFCMIKADELYQLYVLEAARGSGAAAALIAEAEARLAASGIRTAWLACAIGNDRAARFYEKAGWQRVGNMINRLDTPEGIFQLEVWRYEKQLGISR